MAIYRAALAARRAAPYTPPRPLQVGDLVLTSTEPQLAQITAIDGDGAVLAPLINTETDEVDDPARRFGWQTHELRLIPRPPLPLPAVYCSPPSEVSAEDRARLTEHWLHSITARPEIDAWAEQQKDNGQAEDKVESATAIQTRLAGAINLFHQFISRWEDVANDSREHEMDCVLMAHVDRVIDALDRQFMALVSQTTCAVGGALESATDNILPPPKSALEPSAFENVLRFASDVKALQSRALDFAEADGGLSEHEIVEPFDTVLEAVMGKLGPRYLDEHHLQNDPGAKATAWLAKNRQVTP